eukprot:NODE_19_length_39463_cov_0.396073.p31 type:complete len:101 gc:universal NODE_19_length_39463_cov_0.396073:36605-36907(+)
MSNLFWMKQSILSGVLASLASVSAKQGNVLGCVFLNILMWYVYKYALMEYNSVRVQSINMTAQIICSCIFGYLVFGESLTSNNLIQILLMIAGVFILDNK